MFDRLLGVAGMGRRKREGRTIAVLAHHGMGDLLLMRPLLSNVLRGLEEQDRFVVIVKGRLEHSVVLKMGLVRKPEVWIVGDVSGLARAIRFGCVALRLRCLRAKILIIPLFLDSFLNAIWLKAVGANISVGPAGKWLRMGFTRSVSERMDGSEHQLEFCIRCGVAAGFSAVEASSVRIPLEMGDIDRTKCLIGIEHRASVLIGFGAGSGAAEAHKRWPARHFSELARMLLGYDARIKILLFGSMLEVELLSSIVTMSKSIRERFCIFSDLEFGQSLALMSKCLCMVAGTTGIGHMAAAAGVPVVVPCEPTNPSLCRPYGENVWVLRAGLKCGPCYREGFITGCGELDCMSLIQPVRVFEAVRAVLNGGSPPPVLKLVTTAARHAELEPLPGETQGSR